MSMLLFLFGITLSCSAKLPKKQAASQLFTADSVAIDSLGDSICSIIDNAVWVKAYTIAAPNDTTANRSKVTIPTKDKSIVKFIVTDPVNYQSDAPVFGLFIPQFGLSFATRKAEVAAIFDFGLGKWQIINQEGKVVRQFDLRSDNMFRYACILFPDDEFFKALKKATEQE